MYVHEYTENENVKEKINNILKSWKFKDLNLGMFKDI